MDDRIRRKFPNRFKEGADRGMVTDDLERWADLKYIGEIDRHLLVNNASIENQSEIP